MQGIYLITNNLNNKKYVGQSINIKIRWQQHRNSYLTHKETCPKLYNAFKKYGIENFTFSILEEVKNNEELNKKEEFWILKLDTINSGYNTVLPQNVFRGDENYQARLNENQIKNIWNELKNSSRTILEIAKEYQVAYSTIYRINRGEIRFNSLIDYPIRKDNLEARPGSQNGRSMITEKEVLKIRQRYVNETVDNIYQDYKNIYSYSGFKKIVQGVTFKNVPVYSKREKNWK